MEKPFSLHLLFPECIEINRPDISKFCMDFKFSKPEQYIIYDDNELKFLNYIINNSLPIHLESCNTKDGKSLCE